MKAKQITKEILQEALIGRSINEAVFLLETHRTTVDRLIKKHNLQYDKEASKRARSEGGRRGRQALEEKTIDQSGENNSNWKGGISKNNYRYRKIQIERYPEKNLARTMVRNAIRSGKLKRMPCIKCGEIKVHGHHEDYSKPLEVIWLCRKHHRELHDNRH